jgi:hypothetical protein
MTPDPIQELVAMLALMGSALSCAVSLCYLALAIQDERPPKR